MKFEVGDVVSYKDDRRANKAIYTIVSIDDKKYVALSSAQGATIFSNAYSSHDISVEIVIYIGQEHYYDITRNGELIEQDYGFSKDLNKILKED